MCRTIFSPRKFLYGGEFTLVLLVLVRFSFFPHSFFSHVRVCVHGFLVPDLQTEFTLVILLNVDVDGEMGIDVSHLVLVALCDAGHEVLDDGLDGSEGSDILAGAVVDLDAHELLAFLALGQGEGDGDVGEILGQFACRITRWLVSFDALVLSFRTVVCDQRVDGSRASLSVRTSRSLNRHDSGADVDFDIVWDDQLLFGKDVLHLEQWCWSG